MEPLARHELDKRTELEAHRAELLLKEAEHARVAAVDPNHTDLQQLEDVIRKLKEDSKHTTARLAKFEKHRTFASIYGPSQMKEAYQA